MIIISKLTQEYEEYVKYLDYCKKTNNHIFYNSKYYKYFNIAFNFEHLTGTSGSSGGGGAYGGYYKALKFEEWREDKDIIDLIIEKLKRDENNFKTI